MSNFLCPSCEENPKSKPAWGPGPWQDEPDYVPAFHHAGLLCLLHRPHGAWCGYVGVPPGHPAHGKGYEEIDVHVHGGLTYAAPCFGHICHTPGPGDVDDVWWLGFDCAHAWDFDPGRAALMAEMGLPAIPRFNEHYWTLEEAKAETVGLAEQLAAMTGR